MTSPVVGKIITRLESDRGYSHWKQSYHRDMVSCWAIALRNAVEPRGSDWDAREAAYMQLVEKYGRDTISLWADVMGEILLAAINEMGDLLGEITMALGMGVKGHGQFFTPYNLSRLAAAMAFDKASAEQTIAEQGYVSLNEPSSGSGGMIVAYAQTMVEAGLDLQDLRVTAQDIDQHCVNMTYVQMRLFNIPAVVIHGDTLKLEQRETLLTPAYIRQENRLRQKG